MLPPESEFPNAKIITFPIYAICVGIAMILTFNYQPSSKLLNRVKKLEWYQMIEKMLNTNNGDGAALTVYPNQGLLISPSENFNKTSDFMSESFNISNNNYNFVPFPSQNYFSNFLDYILKQTNLVYEQLDIIYRPLPFEDYWAFASIPIFYIIFSIFKLFTLKKGPQPIASGKVMSNLNEAMNEKFGEQHLVKNSKVKFTDVIGCQEAKLEISEFVSYMKSPEKFEKLNARIPKGAILHGPPGTGKTLLAKALASECQTSFFACSGSDFVQMFVGVGAARVRNLFETARKYKPSIIFIDEIDAVATDRSVSNYSYSEKESTLNQLLSEMDGFQDNKDIIVIAGTNKFNYLDKAILRPGRFDRHIFVGPPDLNDRQELFKYYLKPLNILPTLKIEEISKILAQKNPGFTGASISNICNEAAIIATRENSDYINMSHFDKAEDRIRVGAKTGKKLSPSDRNVVSIHEAGHAIIGWNLPTINLLNKVTIVPRGSALGFAQYEPKDINFMSQQQLYEQLILLFGGRAAEEFILNEITTSARDDIEKATKLAYQMVAVFGMDPDIKNLSFQSMTDHTAGFFGEKREFSSKIGNKIDEKVGILLNNAYQEAVLIIKNNKEKLLKISKMLEKRETILHKDVELILGPKKLKPENDLILNAS